MSATYPLVTPPGLEDDIRVEEGAPGQVVNDKILGTQPASYADLPLTWRMMSSGTEFVKVEGEFVYPYSPKDCFSLMLEYQYMLSFYMRDNEKDAHAAGLTTFKAKPQIWREIPNDICRNGVGSQFRYSYYDGGVVCSLVEEVIVCDADRKDNDGNTIYRFGVHNSQELAVPLHPLKDHDWLMVFTNFQGDANKCHIKWVRQFREPKVGPISLAKMFKESMDALTQRNLFMHFTVYNRRFNPKLPKKSSKVLVVGAGPSGLHMAHALRQRGLPADNVTILEKSDRYGGKTVSELDKTNVCLANPHYTWDGTLDLSGQDPDDYYKGGDPIYHELGTCYLSPGYYALRYLLKELQARSPKTAVDLTEEVGPDSYSFESPSQEQPSLGMIEWLYDSGKDKTWLDDLLALTGIPGSSLAGVAVAVLKAKRKYCRLHQQMMGNYYYTLPPRPTVDKYPDLVTKFGDFLTKERLDVLVPLFTYGMTAQGYGLIEDTATYWAMTWLTPDVLDGYFEWFLFFTAMKKRNGEYRKIFEHYRKAMAEAGADIEKFDNPQKGMLTAGWGALWDRIVDLNGFSGKIRYNSDITKITRTAATTNGVTVEYTYSEQDLTEQYDFLVVGAPMSDPVVDPSVPTLPLDFTDAEKRVFLDPTTVAGTFRTNLFKPPKNGLYARNHLRVFTDAILRNDANPTVIPGTGDVFAVRDSYKALQPGLCTENGNASDPKRFSEREKMCYQYVSPSQSVSSEELDKKLSAFFAEHKDFAASEANLLPTSTNPSWTYFTHWNGSGFKDGKLWDALELQGEMNTYFVHASTNFESVLDIVNYNHMMLDGFSGNLDDLAKPESDKRPDECQRPQNFLLNSDNSWFRASFRNALNLVIRGIYTVWYVLSYHIAEATWLRTNRYELQVAFETPELGDPRDYDMSKFLSVSPTVRGYVDYIEEKPSQFPDEDGPVPPDYDPYEYDTRVGPGDNVFKIVEAPKFKFHEQNPGIPAYPEVRFSMQWNMTDFRRAIRHWLATFDDGYLVFLRPWMLSIIEFVGYALPNFYGFVMSWIFANQFRLLIGYSYRFEDARGGGLRIPDCHMLRVAIQDYGVEVGRKVCLTVCKIFTEEVMREKQMLIDLQPDFVHDLPGNGCNIRTTPFREHAFSNHSKYEVRTNSEKADFETLKSFDW